jgi:hypothetical protein
MTQTKICKQAQQTDKLFHMMIYFDHTKARDLFFLMLNFNKTSTGYKEREIEAI